MIVHCKYDALVERRALKPHPKNRNEHPEEQIARLAQILRYQGLRAPIVVSKLSGYIVKGHGTCEAAWLNGWNEVPVVYQEFETEEQEYSFVQSDNAIASWADLNLKGIGEDITDFGPDFDIELLGIKDFVIEPADKFEEPKPEPEDVAQFIVAIECTDETQMEALFNEMQDRGLKCRLIR